MTARALWSSLQARGVSLTLVAGRVHVGAPAGVLTEEDRTALREHRDALLLEMGELEVHERDTGGRRAKVVRRIQAARTTAGAAA